MKSLLATAVLLLAASLAQAGQAQAVNADDALAALQRGAAVLDLRSASQYAQGHLQGAVRLPADAHAQSIDQIAQLLSHAGADSSRTLLVVGDSGASNAQALWQRLSQVTSGRVLWLVGGVQEWQLRGHALTREVPERKPVPQVLVSFDVQPSSHMAGRAVRSGAQLERPQVVSSVFN